jgi:nitroimidazol reductase NimA-like FMN-containing flavoprotein (pyridoxamine 5'-phosphate oxidase superfamily)/osmotically-inducible protein OsmY
VTAPLIEVLPASQGEKLLARNRVGRIAFTNQGRVNILPIHYRYDDGWIYGRTQPGGKLLLILRNRRVAFEVDEHVDVFDWRSVVAHGTFYIIEQSDKKVYDRAVELLREIVPATMSAGDPTPSRTHFFRINVAELTGRSATPTGGKIVEASDEVPAESAVAEEDIALRNAVREAVQRVDHADTSRVTVEVMEGIVILGGVVSTHQESAEIERAVAGVRDARLIVFQIEVDSPDEAAPDAVDLARSLSQTLKGRGMLTGADDVRVIVENGWIRAEGTVASAKRHEDLVRELRTIRGSRGFLDRVRVA